MNIGKVEKLKVCISLVGFHSKKYGFFCREMCLIDCNSNYMFHTTLKLPNGFDYGFSRDGSRELLQIAFSDGLGNDCGGLDIDKMIRKVTPIIQNKTVIVTKSYEVEWMKNIFNLCGSIDCVLITHTYHEKKKSNLDQHSVCDYHPLVDSETIWYECARRSALDLKKTVCNIDSLISDASNTFCLYTIGLYIRGYVCKEICLAHLTSDFIFHTTVKTPTKYRKLMKELKHQNHNGTISDGGEIDLRQLKKQIVPILMGKRVIIINIGSSREIVKWLIDIFDGYYIEFTIIGDWFENCFLDFDSPPDCNYHPEIYHKNVCCAKALALNSKQALLCMQK